jgi:hypothetical protein
MAKITVLFIFLLFIHSVTISQTISGKIIHQKTQDPIKNVAVVSNIKTGTTSNILGEFSLNLKNTATLSFSCLGYQKKTLTISQLANTNYVVTLIEDINQLEEIQLYISKIPLDSLLVKTTKSMNKNYLSETLKQELYAVENKKIDLKKLSLELKSSSLLSRKNKKLAEQELKEFSENIQRRKPVFTSEFKAQVYSQEMYFKKGNTTYTQLIIDSIQRYRKATISEGITVKNITKKLQLIILKYLNTDSNYKIKSGLFKVEDSLSLKEVSKMSDSIKKGNSFRNSEAINSISNSKGMGAFFKTKSEKNFLNKKYYKHRLENNTILGSLKYYVISFQPRKSKAKYVGKMFIDPSDFSIKKITYGYAKGKKGEHLNLKLLLGVKFSENKNHVTLFYEKNKNKKIYTSYFHETKSNYIYINRPFKFIENTKERNKVKFNIKLEINMIETLEVFSKNTRSTPLRKMINKESLKKKTVFMTKEAYNSSHWKNRIMMHKYLEKYQ